MIVERQPIRSHLSFERIRAAERKCHKVVPPHICERRDLAHEFAILEDFI